jgi:NitT/TauT family transport system substrate-binding protein
VRYLDLKRLLALMGALCLLVVAGGCGGDDESTASNDGSASSAGPAKVTLRADVFFYGAHVPLLAGIEEGIYEKYGLEVTAKEGTGSGTTAQLVANGSDDFGFVDGGVLVQSVAKGISAEMVVGMLEQSPMIVMSRQEAGISEPKDLNGKTGGFSPGSAPELVFPALAKATGIDEGSLEKRQVDIPTRDSLFVQGETDFTFGYTATQLPILEEKCKCKLAVIKYSDHGVNPMSNGIVVSQEFAETNPDTVKRFAAATQEAIEFAVDNPEKAVDQFFAYAKQTQLSRQVVADQWMNATSLLHTPETEDLPYGCMAEADWQRTIDLLVQYGGVPEGRLEPADVFDNSYLPGGCEPTG